MTKGGNNVSFHFIQKCYDDVELLRATSQINIFIIFFVLQPQPYIILLQ